MTSARLARRSGRRSRRRIHTFIATSPIHMEKKLRMTPDQVVEAAVKAIGLAREYTDDVEFSAEDAVRSDIDFLCRVFDAVIAAGATTINVPDTVGYSIPSVWGERMRTLIERVPNADKVVWSTHCHNDLGMAVANSLAAVLAGARQVECTINGLGERAGNASLEEVVMAVKTRSDLFPRRDAHRHDADRAGLATGLADHRLSGAAEQGDRRRQCLRPRVRHSSGRRAQAPRNLRDHARRRMSAGRRTSWCSASIPGATPSRRRLQELGITARQRRGAQRRLCPLQGTGRQEARNLRRGSACAGVRRSGRACARALQAGLLQVPLAKPARCRMPN